MPKKSSKITKPKKAAPKKVSAKKAAPGVEANLKELDSNFKNFFTQLGKELPPGQKPEPFVDPEEGAE